jgi:quercetin dioxygenase-like cupin family protein
LFVTEGEGWVQSRGAGAQRIRVGDAVMTEPNEEHWHGAGRGGPFAHLVVNIGETHWLEESPPPPD